MQITKKDVQAVIGTVKKAVAHRAKDAQLVTLSSDGTTLTVSHANGTYWLASSTPLAVTGEPLAVTVDADVVKVLSKMRGTITLTVDANKLIAQDTHGTTIIPAKSFVPQAHDWQTLATVPAAALIEPLAQVIFAASTNQAVPALANVLMQFGSNGIRATATNGAVIAHAHYASERLPNATLLIPAAGVQTLVDLAPSGEIHIYTDATHTVRLIFGNTTMDLTLFDIKKYPPALLVQDKQGVPILNVSRKALKTALDRIALAYGDGDARTVRLVLADGTAKLIAAATSRVDYTLGAAQGEHDMLLHFDAFVAAVKASPDEDFTLLARENGLIMLGAMAQYTLATVREVVKNGRFT